LPFVRFQYQPKVTIPGAKPGAALFGLFRRDQLRVTLASALLSVGVIGAGVACWLPTYLEPGAPPDGSRASAPTWAFR
jgi:hypothetical protein